ncbi:hypothetical protein CTA2_2208 [Colletotrichum tanaceti]|uniref:Uncharacterized protein n=1 Tax=Colletotrichum tanaceti TaxID=1306861 RepID=A0A4U6XFL5_9PEZI|nr:hypothetical protein CTA2_2208 [Colletotrichum tanaceti]TKW54022.1 hypothetical protein CTA1_8085 [Colletotrichum tanaceti]
MQFQLALLALGGFVFSWATALMHEAHISFDLPLTTAASSPRLEQGMKDHGPRTTSTFKPTYSGIRDTGKETCGPSGVRDSTARRRGAAPEKRPGLPRDRVQHKVHRAARHREMAFFRDGPALDDGDDDQQFQDRIRHDSAHHPVCDFGRFRLAYAGLHGNPDSNRRTVIRRNQSRRPGSGSGVRGNGFRIVYGLVSLARVTTVHA